MRSRLLGFGPGGYPSHAYFSPPCKNKYVIKAHLTLIRFRASGVPISRNSHLTIKNASTWKYFCWKFESEFPEFGIRITLNLKCVPRFPRRACEACLGARSAVLKATLLQRVERLASAEPPTRTPKLKVWVTGIRTRTDIVPCTTKLWRARSRLYRSRSSESKYSFCSICQAHSFAHFCVGNQLSHRFAPV